MEIDPDALEKLRESWKVINSGIITQHKSCHLKLVVIENELSAMGLNMDNDDTYELIAPGLTRGEFERTRAYLLMLEIFEEYHRAQNLRHDYDHEQAPAKYYALKRLTERSLPRFEKSAADAGLPLEKITPLQLQELDFIRQMYKAGLLHDELKRTAYAAAQEKFRTAMDYAAMVELQESKGELTTQASKEGLIYAEAALAMIDAAGEHYKPASIPASYGLQGWDDTLGTMRFSREAADSLRCFFLIRHEGVAPSRSRMGMEP